MGPLVRPGSFKEQDVPAQEDGILASFCIPVESLESRTLLTYTFMYTPATNTATATGGTDTESLVISPITTPTGVLLEHSVGGGAFDSNWGGIEGTVTVPATGTVTANVVLSTGDGSSFQLGGNSGANVGGPASALMRATFSLTVPVDNTSDTVVIDDSTSTAASTYTLDPGNIVGNYPITGRGFNGRGFNFQEPTGIASGGITLKGSSGAPATSTTSCRASTALTRSLLSSA